MDDVRRAAEECAARLDRPPVGASFESERQRKKRACAAARPLDGRNIRKIAAASENPEEDKVLRVAAYCRVSTDDIDQAISITFQIREYKRKILANPNWKYVGTYVDDGFSGTKTEHRQGFQKLMRDAMDGKIDTIITKAVSRFARNLMDCIGWVEVLQNHDPPVRVFFEQENLDTMSQTSSIILFVLAMVAQEKSHMKSEAILLSLEWRFSRGRFLTPRLFGYDKVEVPDGFGGKIKILAINESEARVVRWMYGTLLNGGTPEEIASVLTEMAIPTGGRRKDGTLNTHWTASSVIATMQHCGDVLARKTYTPNYKDHKAKKNNGRKNKYFQPDHHDAIVSRAMWNAAQRILNSRRYGHEGTYLPMRIILEGTLTGYISMNRAWAGFDYEDYYRASQIAMGMLDEDLQTDLGAEYLPEAGRRVGGLVDDHGIAQIARDLTAAEQEIKDELEGRAAEKAETQSQEEVVRSFQVVSGDMFSRSTDPVIHVSKNGIRFNKCCTTRLSDAAFVEPLFNPVERMLIIRPCSESHPNAISWDSSYKSAAPLAWAVFNSMGWDLGYTFRAPCQTVVKRDGLDAGRSVLVFDLDNFIGRTDLKKDEAIVSEKRAESKPQPEDAKSYFYPPDEEEPEEILELEERFLRAVENNQKIFGTPVFEHDSSFRVLNGETADGHWDMLAEAKPLDIQHTVDTAAVDGLLLEIMDDPPPLLLNKGVFPGEIISQETEVD